MLCARQNIGLRWHRENKDAQNKGNFLEILRHIAEYDKVVADRLREGSINANYTAPSIQNEILDFLACMVRQKVCSGVRESGVYTVLADETKDLSKKEQLSIIQDLLMNKQSYVSTSLLLYMLSVLVLIA